MSIPKSFEELIKSSDKPVLVDFYADWCGPCKALSPVIKQIAGEYKSRVTTIKIDTEKKQNIALKYGIQSIPTIMLFHNGEVKMRLNGAYPYPSLKKELDQVLSTIR